MHNQIQKSLEKKPCVVCDIDTHDYIVQQEYIYDEYGNPIAPIEKEIQIHESCLQHEIDNFKVFDKDHLMIVFIIISMCILIGLLATL